MDEILEIFRRNFPYVSREEQTLLSIIHHEGNATYRRRDSEGRLIGCAIVNRNTILLLVVDKEHRNQGIGSDLLRACEETIVKDGLEKVILGVGFDYLLPGVPTSRRFAPSVHEHLDPFVNTKASDFFEQRGYRHSWGACNCFDMKISLSDFCLNDHAVGDTINGISYRWATIADMKEILRCADDACQYQEDSFSKYYDNASLYTPGHRQRVLIATRNDRIVGTLIVSVETEAKGVGNVGYTCVASNETHQGIATNMVKLGTRYLKDIGLEKASLSYTYSGLDVLYGASGYEISTYYFMGERVVKGIFAQYLT